MLQGRLRSEVDELVTKRFATTMIQSVVQTIAFRVNTVGLVSVHALVMHTSVCFFTRFPALKTDSSVITVVIFRLGFWAIHTATNTLVIVINIIKNIIVTFIV